jgi:hypothetical protein
LDGTIWLVAILADVFAAPHEIVYAGVAFGLLARLVECLAPKEDRALKLQLIIAIVIGGAIGSVARYLVGIGSGKLFGFFLPLGTPIINIVGSFLIGIFVESFALGFAAGRKSVSNGRNLWRLHNFFRVLAGCVCLVATGRAVACRRLHGRFGGFVCRGSLRWPSPDPGRFLI